jgi:hypothetical protein
METPLGQAVSLYKQALKALEQQLGSQHPTTLTMQEEVNSLFEAMRRNRDALS